MTPQVEPVRQMYGLGWMLLCAGLVGGVAGAVTTWALTARPTAAPVATSCFDHLRAPSIEPFHAQLSPRTRTFDVMSPGDFTADGSPDEVYDLEIDAEQPIRHIYVINDAQGLQWDTVIGDELITYSERFAGHRGAETWHLGVRENGTWLNAPDGEIRGLAAGHHLLELVATSPQAFGPRMITVQYADGTWREVRIRS